MTEDDANTLNFQQLGQHLTRYEAADVAKLRAICEAIGYGRVIQLAEQWMDEKHPGWLKAKAQVMAEALEK